ncbi:MAG: hypothetical protein DMF80_04090 [Acidobacteria bacterium]|nr:MAG: hypothetical protein DMF80_04090 [Acidobacteriota bacterium]
MKLPGAGVVLAAVAAAGELRGAERPRIVTSPNEVESAVVEVVSIHGRGGPRTRHGSAFYIGEAGDLLTCFHVLDHMPREDAPRLRLADGRERLFEVVDVDREVDLALLRSDAPERFLALAPELLPEIGQPALFGGLTRREGDVPPSPPLSLRRCTVVARGSRRAPRGHGAVLNIELDQIADPGHSGGPLLAETTLAVIGVMRANLERATGGTAGAKPEGHALAVPLMYVRPFVARNLNLPNAACVSPSDKQEAEVCARHGWRGSRCCSGQPSTPRPTSGPISTP